MAFPQVSVLTAATVLALATANAPYAAAAAAPGAAACVPGKSETRGHSAVDDLEIRFTEASRYDDLRKYAISEWNKLRKINIAPDSATTVNDLEFRDYTSKTDGHGGYYEHRGGVAATDYIYLNTHFLDTVYGAEPKFRQNIVVHELGHALGLCHKADTVDTVIREGFSPKNVPTPVDKANYSKLWG
ncbi:hypothetical protein [Streptomyces sp. NPDC094049]|uniref:hypothetical protein n=1 Tax=Streptomyces sp. NPDC094049 TaxID=3154987 RepID=UPI003328D8FB